MATKDFRAGQLETSKIIGSGSISGTGVGIAIYSGSIASDREGGVSDAAIFNNVGSDVFLFVSGSANTRTGVTLFGGDLVVSGTLYAERQIIEVDETTTGSLLVSGSLTVSQSVTINEGLVVNSSGETGPENDFVVYGLAGYRPIFVDVSSNSVLINADADPIITKIHNSTDEAINVDSSGVVINEQSDNTIDFRVETNNLQGAIVVDASHEIVMLGSNETNVTAESLGSDVNLFFSGSAGTKDTAQKGTAVFAGDVVFSGSIYPGGATETLNIGSADQAYLGVYSKEFHGDLQGSIRFSAINDEGDSISKGQVVYIKGIQGQTPTVALAACDDPNKMPAFGLAATNAADGAAVEIVTVGDLSNFNINTLYGGIFLEGDVLYVATGSNHTSGSLTNIRPKGGENLLQNMGFVVRDGGGGDSRVKVGGAGRSNATPNLNDGQIFIGDSTNCSTTASLDLNLAYASGSGAIIGVDGQPVQLVADYGDKALAVTGSAIFGASSPQFSNHLPPMPGSDTHFFVSGAVGGKDDTRPNISVFGGDTVVSGVFYSVDEMRAFNNIRISDTQGNAFPTLYMNAAGSVKLQEDNNSLIIDGNNNLYLVFDDSLRFSADAESNPVFVCSNSPGTLGIKGSLFNHGQDSDQDFSVSTTNQKRAIFVSSSDDSVMIHAEGLPPVASDTHFFVSGAIGGKGTTGTAVFGGDVVVSGTLYGQSNSVIQEGLTVNDARAGATTNDFTVYNDAGKKSIFVDTDVGDVEFYGGNINGSFLKIDAAIQEVVVNTEEIPRIGGHYDVNFRVASKNLDSAILVDADDNQVLIGSNEVNAADENVGTDVVLYVSGTTPSGGGGKGTPGGTTVLNSDLVVSGTYRGGYDTNAGSESFQAISDNYLFMSNPNDFGSPQIEATDSNFFFTGSIGSRGGGTPGTAVFGGDLHVSGAITSDGGAPAPTYRYEYLLLETTITSTTSDFLNVFQAGTSFSSSTAATKFITPASGSIERILVTPTQTGSPFNGEPVIFWFRRNRLDGKFDISNIEAIVTGSTDIPFTLAGTTDYKAIIDCTGNTLTVSGSNSFNPGDMLHFQVRSETNTLGSCGIQVVLKFDESVTYP
jgi:hypothetical protein